MRHKMSENEQKQHESFRRTFEKMLNFMESKRVPTDINFRALLKTPTKDFRKSHLS